MKSGYETPKQVTHKGRYLCPIPEMGASKAEIWCPGCVKNPEDRSTIEDDPDGKRVYYRDPKIGHTAECRKGHTCELVYYRPVTNPAELQWYIDDAKNAPSTSYDFETTGLNVFQDKLVGVSFCREDQPGVAIYVPMGHKYGQNIDEAVVREIVAPFLRDYPMNAHNFDMELRWTFYKWKVMPRVNSDTMAEVWFDDPNRTSRFDLRSIGLKESCHEIFGYVGTTYDDLVTNDQMTFADVPVDKAWAYGCQDSDLSTKLIFALRRKNISNQVIPHWLEHQLIPVTSNMRLVGVELDPNMLQAALPSLLAEIEQLELETYRLMGFDVPEDADGWFDKPLVDLDSPTQVAKILFKDCGVPIDPEFIGKPTKTFPEGQPSVSKKALETIRDGYEVIDTMLKYKEAKYVFTNYITKLPNWVEVVTNSLHAGINQFGTPTARFTVSKPPLQGIVKVRD